MGAVLIVLLVGAPFPTFSGNLWPGGLGRLDYVGETVSSLVVLAPRDDTLLQFRGVVSYVLFLVVLTLLALHLRCMPLWRARA
jgi:hypothetical protein